MARLFKDPYDFTEQAETIVHLKADTERLKAEALKMKLLEPYVVKEMEATIAAKNAQTRSDNVLTEEVIKNSDTNSQIKKIELATNKQEFDELLSTAPGRKAASEVARVKDQDLLDFKTENPKEFSAWVRASMRKDKLQLDAAEFQLSTQRQYDAIGRINSIIGGLGVSGANNNIKEINRIYQESFGRPLVPEGQILSETQLQVLAAQKQHLIYSLDFAQQALLKDKEVEAQVGLRSAALVQQNLENAEKRLPEIRKNTGMAIATQLGGKLGELDATGTPIDLSTPLAQTSADLKELISNGIARIMQINPTNNPAAIAVSAARLFEPWEVDLSWAPSGENMFLIPTSMLDTTVSPPRALTKEDIVSGLTKHVEEYVVREKFEGRPVSTQDRARFVRESLQSLYKRKLQEAGLY